jgi:hypothetical protein
MSTIISPITRLFNLTLTPVRSYIVGGGNEMSKDRSPNYPQLGLSEALEKVRQVYDAEHCHAASREVVVQDMGYKNLNGASLTVLGALRHYGLLDKAGSDGLVVTSDAVDILELPKGDKARNMALCKCALAPPIFSQMFEEFGDMLPSEANQRHWLIKKHFIPKASDTIIRIFRENMELVKDALGDYYDAVATAPKGNSTMQTEPRNALPTRKTELATSGNIAPTGKTLKSYSWGLSGSTTARLEIAGDADLSGDDLETLRQFVDITIKALSRPAKKQEPNT